MDFKLMRKDNDQHVNTYIVTLVTVIERKMFCLN